MALHLVPWQRGKASQKKARQEETHVYRTPTSFTVLFGRYIINSGGSYRGKKKKQMVSVNEEEFTSVEFISILVVLRKLVVI